LNNRGVPPVFLKLDLYCSQIRERISENTFQDYSDYKKRDNGDTVAFGVRKTVSDDLEEQTENATPQKSLCRVKEPEKKS